MNWTGGRLQRHSKAGNSLKHKQEQHFAKVKKNLLSGGRKSTSKQPNLDRMRQLHEVQRDSGSDALEARGGFSLEGNNDTNLRNDSQLSRENLRRQSDMSAHRNRTTQHPQVFPRVTDEDIYSATPQSRSLKRERNSHSPEVDRKNETPLEEESLSEKRRNILRKGDWASIGFQRPPQLEYTAPKSHEKVGRRRKITDGYRAQYSGNKRPRVLPPASRMQQLLPLPSDILKEEKSRRSGRSDVRISIGGKVVPPGISSSSVPSKGVDRSSARPLSHRTLSKSSDIMLLDCQRSHSQNNSFHSRSVASQQSAEVQETKRPTFSSSSASLRHPIPQSSKVSSLLRSASSNIDESLIAYVGRPRPIVPSSQMPDNEVWKTWMESLLPFENGVDSQDSSYGDLARTYQSTISPGISAAPTYGIVDQREDGNTASLDRDGVYSDDSKHLESSEIDDAYEDKDTAYYKPKTNMEFREATTLSSEASFASPTQSSPLPPLAFKILSPIAESDRTDPHQSRETNESSSVDDTYYADDRVMNKIQQSNPTMTVEEHVSNVSSPKIADMTGDVSKVLDINTEKSPYLCEMEDDPGDEIWKRIVFGSDNEEVDIFVNGILGANSSRNNVHSPQYRQAACGSVLSLIEEPSLEGANNSIPSSTSRRRSVSDFRSQFVQDGSHDVSGSETDLMTKPDYRSTVGNADSSDTTSAYFQSSESAPTQTTEAAATNMADRGSSIDVDESTTYGRPRRRFALTQSTKY
jgi:hypothetical protein